MMMMMMMMMMTIMMMIIIIIYFKLYSIGSSNTSVSTSFVRVARLFRLFRLMLITDTSEETLNLLIRTLEDSRDALAFLIFCAIIITIIIGSVAYMLECGTFRVTAEYPDGDYLRVTVNGEGHERSPYISVSAAIYWACVTITTVGGCGRVVCVCVCVFVYVFCQMTFLRRLIN